MFGQSIIAMQLKHHRKYFFPWKILGKYDRKKSLESSLKKKKNSRKNPQVLIEQQQDVLHKYLSVIV